MQNVLYVYQNYRNSYSSASTSILRGLEQIETLEVSHLEIKPITRSNFLNRVFNRIPFISTLHFKNQNKRLKAKILRGNFDVLFIMKGTDIKPYTLQAIKELKPKLQMYCFNPDDPFNPASSNEYILNSIKLYDKYFIWTKHLNEKLIAAGAEKVVYFPFGIDDKIIYPVTSKLKYDISFIGNGDLERHNWIKDTSTELLKRGLPIIIHVFGSNWPIIAENVVTHGQKNGEELLKTIAASKINLNLLRRQNKNAINMRTFEIPAVGGFMMHEASEEAEEFFVADKEVVYFNSVADLVDKTIHYLEDEKDRKAVITACVQKIGEQSYSYKTVLERCI